MSARAFLKTEMGKIALFLIVVALLGFAISMLSTKTIEGMVDSPVSTEEEGSNPTNILNLASISELSKNTASQSDTKSETKSDDSSTEKDAPKAPVGAPESTSSTEQCYTLQECSYTDGNVDMSSCKVIKTCMNPTPSVSGNITAKKCMISTAGAATDPSMCWTSNVSDLTEGVNIQYI